MTLMAYRHTAVLESKTLYQACETNQNLDFHGNPTSGVNDGMELAVLA